MTNFAAARNMLGLRKLTYDSDNIVIADKGQGISLMHNYDQ